MADYSEITHKETVLQTLNAIIQLHFDKTLEKKRAVDLQKKELWKLFQLFFFFLCLVFMAEVQSSRLHCRHCWVPIGLISLAHLIFHVSAAQTLRCINEFKYQRRCHKLTLGLATERLGQIKMRMSSSVGGVDDEGGGDEDGGGGGGVMAEEFEIQYQEPPESYSRKFKRKWGLYFGFLSLIYGFMVSSSAVLLCF